MIKYEVENTNTQKSAFESKSWNPTDDLFTFLCPVLCKRINVNRKFRFSYYSHCEYSRLLSLAATLPFIYYATTTMAVVYRMI